MLRCLLMIFKNRATAQEEPHSPSLRSPVEVTRLKRAPRPKAKVVARRGPGRTSKGTSLAMEKAGMPMLIGMPPVEVTRLKLVAGVPKAAQKSQKHSMAM